MAPPDGTTTETRLQRQLMRAITAHLRESGLQPGDTLSLQALARRFGVSRSPVRAALARLAELGVVDQTGGGARVIDPDAAPDLTGAPVTEEVPDATEALMAAIARDHFEGRIGAEVSESELIRRHGRSRAEIVAALRRMADFGLVHRKPGFGWRFADEIDHDARRESYRFRLILEPAALMEPGYRPDPVWLRDCRDRHRRYRDQSWQPDHAIGFFEMNAEFHRQLVAFSGNRWMIQAIEQQNSLRRLRNWSWRLDDDRVRDSCNEHLAVLDALIAGDTPGAAQALRRHIESTMESVG
jgi:DNA-binding GntR family transcriptional regulator